MAEVLRTEFGSGSETDNGNSLVIDSIGSPSSVVYGVSLPSAKPKRPPSLVWTCFDKRVVKNQDGTDVLDANGKISMKAVCRYCEMKLAYGSTSGTSHLKRHMNTCRKKPCNIASQPIIGRTDNKEIHHFSSNPKVARHVAMIPIAFANPSSSQQQDFTTQCKDACQSSESQKDSTNAMTMKGSTEETLETQNVTKRRRTTLAEGSEDIDIIMKQRDAIYHLSEARKELINGWKAFPDKNYVVGLKRMGELDPKPFRVACCQKYQTTHEAEEKGLQLCSLWQNKIIDPQWHSNYQELEELKRDYGNEVYDAVCKALIEISDCNSSGRYVVEELWNYRENRKSTLKEAITILLMMKKDQDVAAVQG